VQTLAGSNPLLVGSTPDPEQIFRHGEEAPRGGDLDQAERNSGQVVILNPQVAGAYATSA